MEYTRDDMEVACCFWEAMLELKGKIPELEKAFHHHGTNVMRFVAINLARGVDEEWNELTPDDQEDIGAFDWEFCPMLVRRIDWAQWPIKLA